MRKFTEQSTMGQFGVILGLIAMMTTLFGGVALLAADQAIDQKYATDSDVKAVQEQFAHQVGALSSSVNENTKVSREMSRSVHALTLTMVTIQIRDLEQTVRQLKSEKVAQGVQWSTAAERTLSDMQRTVMDLGVQRQRLIQNPIGDSN
jgi:hypothetical protein